MEIWGKSRNLDIFSILYEKLNSRTRSAALNIFSHNKASTLINYYRQATHPRKYAPQESVNVWKFSLHNGERVNVRDVMKKSRVKGMSTTSRWNTTPFYKNYPIIITRQFHTNSITWGHACIKMYIEKLSLAMFASVIWLS